MRDLTNKQLLVDEELESKIGDMKVHSKDMYDNDIRNSELVIDAHSPDPYKVMRIQTYDDAPMANASDDIVIRVEVSFYTSIFLFLSYFHILNVLIINKYLSPHKCRLQQYVTQIVEFAMVHSVGNSAPNLNSRWSQALIVLASSQVLGLWP